MKEEQKRPKDRLKDYIVAIDFSRFDSLKLYGAGIADTSQTYKLMEAFKDFPYVGKLRSEQKKNIIQAFPVKFRKYEKLIALYASTDRIRIIDFVERRIRDRTALMVVDPKVYSDVRARLSGNTKVMVIVENKQKLKHELGEFTAKLSMSVLNTVDVFMRWARELFIRKRATKYVRIVRGKKEIK